MADENGPDETHVDPQATGSPPADKPRPESFWARSLGRLPRRGMISALVALIIAVLAGVITPVVNGVLSARPSAPTPTADVHYEPWTLNHTTVKDVRIVAKTTGYCFGISGAAPRSDAYRCMEIGHPYLLYDPCFGDPNKLFPVSRVICPDPSPYSATSMNLTRPLPDDSSESATVANPWLIVLTDGQQCHPDTRASPYSGNLRLNYSCPSGGLYGDVHRSSPVWKIEELPNNGSATMVLADIKQAFF
jgi:hypothetical protein